MTWDELKKHDYVVEPMRYRKYEQDGFGTPTGKFEIWSTMMEEWGYDPLPEHVEPTRARSARPRSTRTIPLILNTGVQAADVLAFAWAARCRACAGCSRSRCWRSIRTPQPSTICVDKALCLDRDPARQAAHAGELLARGPTRRSSSVPHGWWLPEWPGPDHGIFEVCSNVLTDDDLDNCDVALGSSPLKGLLCKVYPAEPPDVPRDAGYRQARERTLITTDAEA